MKRIFTLLILLATFSFQGISQDHINYERDSRWYIGLHSGVTWTTLTKTEMDYRLRGGYGMFLGKSIGMNPGKVFSWDIRGSFMHAWYVGQDTRRYYLDDNTTSGLDYYGSSLDAYSDSSSIGFFVPNYKTQLLNGSLELSLNTNRLRERTGINLYLYGGVGVTGYHTSTDLFDQRVSESAIYDYTSSEFTNPSTQFNYISNRDREYETDLAGSEGDLKVDWMPSFGAGISYQFAPYFSMGVEYRKTWARNNDFDGMVNNIDGSSSTNNDVYNYFNGTLKFHLFSSSYTPYVPPKEDPITDINNFDNTDNNNFTPPPPVQKPIVDITNPASSPYTTDYNRFTINANVHYVDGRENIVFKQNGVVNTNFTYNANTDKFESNVNLNPGQNLFEITGTNSAGSDYETTIIIFEEEDVKNPPIVTITNPSSSPHTTNNSIFAFQSTVLNVDSKSQIQVYFNGVNLTSFSYNTSTDVLNTTLTLMEGMNTITVTATNVDGSDSKTAQIIYEKPRTEQPPVVTYIYPSVNPFITTVNNINITASVLNVTGKGSISVKINGNPTSLFAYNNSSKQVTFNTMLIEGANIIEIKGVNSVGQDVESTTIIYQKPETPKPPIVTFVNPNENPITVYTSSYNVTAKVLYVSSKSDITLKINGVETSLFTYSASSKLMNFTTNLVEGTNIIEVKGVNAYGYDVENTMIIYKKPEPKLPPVVTISYPAVDNQVFMTPNITLTSSVLNVISALNIKVIVNGVHTDAFTYNTSTKVLHLPLTLIEGANTVTIIGTNVAGSDEATRTIIHKKPIVPSPPTVTWLNPSASPYSVTTDAYTLTASTTNIDAKSQVTLKMNGMLVPSTGYTFNSAHQIIYHASLMPGNNVFEIIVTNDDGTADDVAVINRIVNSEPCIVPTIGYVSPVPFSTVEEAAITVDAQINNFSSEAIIELKQNGVSKGYMTYNAATSIATKSIVLTEGSNAITVIVTNDCGTNQSNFTLTYILPEAPCSTPELSLTAPAELTTEEESIVFNAIAANVPAKENLSVTNNGTAVPFVYDIGTGTITIDPLNLVVGENNINIIATTDCGIAKIGSKITRTVCEAPVITALSHATGLSLESNTLPFSANVSHATAEEISLIVNGIAQPFSINAATGSLTATINLNVGLNTIAIVVNTACGSASKSISVTRTIPCSPIEVNLITPPAAAIVATSATYNFQLHASHLETASDVSFLFNGAAHDFLFDPVTGNITASLTLIDGENTISVNLSNDCSTEKVGYIITYNGCKPAVMSFVGFTSGMSVEGSSYTVNGSISNVDDPSEISVLVNGVTTDFTYNTGTDLFASVLDLNFGENTVVITVDGCENVTKTIVINASEPCVEITTSPIAPLSSTITTTDAVYSISFSAIGISDVSEISVTLNGAPIPFTLDASTHVITIPTINLIDGSNVVNVFLTNSCSTSELQYSINYDGCEAPVITFGSASSTVSESGFSFDATISNIESADEITATVNGIPFDIVFDAVTGEVAGEVELTEGVNTITLNANGCESASQSITITYEVPCDEITYTLFRPATTALSVATPTVNIMLYAYGVETSGITVTVNGVSVPFTFSGDRIIINGIPLNSGSNTILVTMTNGCSTETATYTVDYADCTSPTIELVSAATTSDLVEYSFSANIGNVESADQLTVTLNDTPAEFSFDITTGVLTATVNLTEGTNTIRITALTCAAYEQFFDVTYALPCAEVGHTLISPTSLASVVEEDHINISLLATNVSSETDISVTLNGASVPFAFTIGNIDINDLTLVEGENEVIVTFGNACSSESLSYIITKPACVSPSIVLISTTTSVSTPSFEFAANILHVDSESDIQLLVNGTSTPFTFNSTTHAMNADLSLVEGSNEVTVIANGCSTSSATYTIEYALPCSPITYSRIIPSVGGAVVDETSYSIQLSATNVVSSGINVTLNGASIPFTFLGGTININGITLVGGETNDIIVTLTNDCSSETIAYEITCNTSTGPCGPRFNPGSSSEQFCLVTPSGTYTRDDLASNPSFSYVGVATAVYFKPIAGGGDATVAGSPYSLLNGKYYLFEGTINVDVSSSHPGSMGHWEICIDASALPTFGSGASKPDSPCATTSSSTDSGTGPGVGGGTTTTVVYEKPIISPIAPRTATSTVTNPTLMYKVKVTNIKVKSDVKLYLNSVETSGFTYNSISNEVVAVLKLQSGANKIKVVAVNGDKTTTYTTTVTYNAGRTGSGTGTGTGGKTTGSGGKTTGSGTTTTGSGKTTEGGTKSTEGGTKTSGGRSTNTNNSGSSGGKTTTTEGKSTTTGGGKTTTSGGRSTNTTNSGKTTTTGGTKTTTGGNGRSGG